MKNQSSLTFNNGVKDGLPIGLGYLSVAFAFGVQASILQIPLIVTILISMTNLTSAGQLQGINVIAAGGTIIEMIVTQLIINSRYFLMSISLSQRLSSDFTVGKRLVAATGITDEIFAVASCKTSPVNFKYFTGLMLLPYIGWVGGTVLGAVAGNILPLNIQLSLGIALYAMFIAIILPPASKSYKILFVVLLSAALSCVFYYVPFLKNNVSGGFITIICALLSSMIAAAIFPVKDDNADKTDAKPNEKSDDNSVDKSGEKSNEKSDNNSVDKSDEEQTIDVNADVSECAENEKGVTEDGNR